MIATLFYDWGYSWIEWNALSIALENNSWIALPHLFALFILVGVGVWGKVFLPHAIILCVLQAILIQVISYLIAPELDVSLLEVAPVIGSNLATLSAFLFVPPSASIIPKSKKWHDIAFKPRENLIRTIASLESQGFEVYPPTTVCESGSAFGSINNTKVMITTEPSPFYLSYALRIRFIFPEKALISQKHLPNFADKEKLVIREGCVSYIGLSKSGFRIDSSVLYNFIQQYVSAMKG